MSERFHVAFYATWWSAARQMPDDLDTPLPGIDQVWLEDDRIQWVDTRCDVERQILVHARLAPGVSTEQEARARVEEVWAGVREWVRVKAAPWGWAPGGVQTVGPGPWHRWLRAEPGLGTDEPPDPWIEALVDDALMDEDEEER